MTNKVLKMTSGNAAEDFVERENLFRKFQIEKFSRKKSIPCVSMMVDINIRMLEEARHTYNSGLQEDERITLTHVLTKAVSIALKDFPLLYGYFDGRKVILSERIRINLPVSEGNHVEYVVIESPESKSLTDIASEVGEEVKRIRSGMGTFYLVLKKLFVLPKLFRSIASNVTSINIRNTYRHYGNFPITNFGSFGAKFGIPVISAPIIGVLCLGMIQRDASESTERMPPSVTILPITMVFDHRPIDGAYCGKFLHALKRLVESGANGIFV
jgi:pyruvate/2-oxoglutarate dehydrogenase complex dihydrolipoamide acyltransferase (E2) component